MSTQVSLALIVLSLLCLQTSTERCGYESCPKPKKDAYNIHIVAHTHDDVGWLKTKDQYYYGENMYIQEAGVQYIIDSVIDALLENPERRFIYVETAFFWMWWVEQTPRRQQVVRELVNEGRLEIIGGAWSMNDEAATHYQSTIDQFSWGFKRLNETLGECATPKIGWQIDPFGHSRENAAIMAKMGFDGLFLGRIDFQDKHNRALKKEFEMIWHTSENDKSESSTLFTSILYNLYMPPNGFCFDVHCKDSPLIDNVKSPEYNIPQRLNSFINAMMKYSYPYRTKNILVTMGGDFHYQYGGMNFRNMDKLIRYVNEFETFNNRTFHAFYSTPSCYLKAVNDEDIDLPDKYDDFFPYASDSASYWTGYYTSRPTQKRFERMGNNYLQVAKQISALANLPLSVDISEAKEAMGMMQHHDAITGTEKQHVADDYSRIFFSAMKSLEVAISQGLNKLTNNSVNNVDSSRNLHFKSCLLLNISSCPETETSKRFVVTVYNPLSRYVDKLVRLPVAFPEMSYTVRDPTGSNIPVQLVPLPYFINIPDRRTNASNEIAFIAENIPPLGFKSYFVEATNEEHELFFRSELVEHNESTWLGYENGAMISLNPSGRINSIRKNNLSEEIPFDQRFLFYNGNSGYYKYGSTRASGAYIFRPNGEAVPVNVRPSIKIIKGPIISEVQQSFSEWVNQVIKLQTGIDHIEFQWNVGPLPDRNYQRDGGIEIITRYTMPGLRSNGTFYTDSNGREMLQRRVSYRPTWNVQLDERISGNYYPVTTRININDEVDHSKTLSVITDRSEGGTSLYDGQLELMLHRRLFHDDGFGVDEALNEYSTGQPLVAIGSHYITLEHSSKARLLVQQKVLDSWISITANVDLTYNDWKNRYNMEFSGLKRILPNNVQILTLEPWLEVSGDNRKIYLVRFENIMEKLDDPTVAEINIKDLFATFTIVNIQEMMLGGNIPKDRSRRLKWKTTKKMVDDNVNFPKENNIDNNIITLRPMEIRSFLIEIS